MSAMRAVCAQSLRLWWREGRLAAVLVVLTVLGVLSVALSLQRAAESERDRLAAEAADRVTFLNQGVRNPHSAAHFSRFAFRPLSPTAALDPGIGPYAGVAVWMEAHRQDPANLRAAEDRVELGRLADLSPAWLLQVLAPLLIIALAFDALAGERERGTWPLLLGSGATARDLIRGKWLALMAVFAPPVVLLALAQVLAGGAHGGESLLRSIGWALGHLAYLMVWMLLALAASLRAARARTALIILLAGWALATLIAPRLSIALAQAQAPIPTSSEFAAAIKKDLDEGLDGQSPPEVRRAQFQQQLLAEYGVEQVQDLPVSLAGMSLQAAERYGNLVFDRHYGKLTDLYRAQERWRRWGALLGPLASLQQISMLAAGTDMGHHVDFIQQAETQRRDIIEVLNMDQATHGVGLEMRYQADAALWDSVPEFDYRLPSWAALAIRQWPDWLLLAAWLGAALWLARRTAIQMERAQ